MITHLTLLLAFSLVVSSQLSSPNETLSFLDDQADSLDNLSYAMPLCPYGGNATVRCNILANDPCFCVNLIPSAPVEPESAEPKHLCNDDYFNYTHIVEIGFNLTITDDTPNWHEGYMNYKDVEANLLILFNENLLDKSLKRHNYHDIYRDLRIMRLWCDNRNSFMSVFIGFKATANTTSDDKNVTLTDLGYDLNSIENTTMLDILYLKSTRKDDLPYNMTLLDI
uniref:CC chemokine binding protein n=1 Tax=Panagrellus redivivus TaxID=6233 RepID=A0A7E4W0S9_PANRE